jgi:hypothetical protein
VGIRGQGMRGIEAIARKVLKVTLQNHQNEKPINKEPKIKEANKETKKGTE